VGLPQEGFSKPCWREFYKKGGTPQRENTPGFFKPPSKKGPPKVVKLGENQIYTMSGKHLFPLCGNPFKNPLEQKSVKKPRVCHKCPPKFHPQKWPMGKTIP